MGAIRRTLNEVKRLALAIQADVRLLLDAKGIDAPRIAEWGSGLESTSLIARPVTVTGIRFQGTVESAKYVQRLVHELTDYRIEYVPAQSIGDTLRRSYFGRLSAEVILTTPLGDDLELPSGWWLVIDNDRGLHAYSHDHIANYYNPGA